MKRFLSAIRAAFFLSIFAFSRVVFSEPGARPPNPSEKLFLLMVLVLLVLITFLLGMLTTRFFFGKKVGMKQPKLYLLSLLFFALWFGIFWLTGLFPTIIALSALFLVGRTM